MGNINQFTQLLQSTFYERFLFWYYFSFYGKTSNWTIYINRCEAANEHPSNVLSQVFGMVKWLCWGHFPHVKFHCGPACPSERCPGYQRDDISHPGVQKSISRRHVIHVLPKKNSSFLCANQNFENDLKEWQVKGWLTDVQLVHVYSACYLFVNEIIVFHMVAELTTLGMRSYV